MPMKETPGRNIAVTMTKIAAGGSIGVEVEGGWVHRRIEEPGFLFEDAVGRTMFVPEKLLKGEKKR